MKPRALRRGDTIALVSPASPLAGDSLDVVQQILHDEGYDTVIAPHALERAAYLAGSDADRAADLTWAFTDPQIDAVLCTRGGYGAARLFPHLDIPKLAASGRIFLGFSDITTLHLALNHAGLATVHAPMGITLSAPRAPWVIDSFRAVLKGEDPIPSDAPPGVPMVGGHAEGIVTGGCLCLLTDSIGTPYPLNAEGKILLIEDVDENPHRIDAMLTHLRNVGILQSAAGIVIGEMTRTDEKVDASIGGRPWREIVQERVANLGIPTIIDYPFGHAKQMLSLPLGIRARLDADAGTLTYLEPLCEASA
ncbi:MAG: LD-carboxypeptidase [Fimbriimonadaceae bacterium]|nr:LD-carboxypeptidase [Fimbriimonadaceae bacterium]